MASPRLRGKPNLREPPREARQQGLASSVASHGEAPKLPELMTTQTSRSQLLPSTSIKASRRRRPPRTAANADLRGARTPPGTLRLYDEHRLQRNFCDKHIHGTCEFTVRHLRTPSCGTPAQAPQIAEHSRQARNLPAS